jgi:dienelactone hydrolase
MKSIGDSTSPSSTPRTSHLNPPPSCTSFSGWLQPVETYFAYPSDKSTEKAILLITDVIGHNFINAQLIADQFAANGYFVVMPDLFAGDPVPLNRPEGFQIMDWLKNHLPDKTDPIIEAALKEMQEKYGCKKIGAVGYCFGAKYVARYLKKGKIDVGYCAHPSFVEEDEILGIQGPFSIAAARMNHFPPTSSTSSRPPHWPEYSLLSLVETDEIFTVEKRQLSEKLLPKTGQPWQINLFSGVEHGFAVRGDPNNPQIRFAKEQAFTQAVVWFNTWLKWVWMNENWTRRRVVSVNPDHL